MSTNRSFTPASSMAFYRACGTKAATRSDRKSVVSSDLEGLRHVPGSRPRPRERRCLQTDRSPLQVRWRSTARVARRRQLDQIGRASCLPILKAFGTYLVHVPGPESDDVYKPIVHPCKFDGVLPRVWHEGGNSIRSEERRVFRS